MKVFKRHDRVEGEFLEKGIILSVGQNLENGKTNGGYIRLEFPFTRQKIVFDPATFFERIASCRPTWFLMWRKPFRSSQTRFIKTFSWLPKNEN